MVNPQRKGKRMRVETYFSESTLEQIARQTGFVQRRSPIHGFNFLMTFTTGMLNTPGGTLAQLAAFLSSTCQTHISPQALDERLGPTAVDFMRTCFHAALDIQRQARELEHLGLLAGFDHVYLVDSTGFNLHPSLAHLFKGSGGSGSAATMRLQVALDYVTGRVYVNIGDLRLGDAPTLFNMISGEEIDLTGRCLILSDLGYFKLDTLERIQDKKLFVLSKLMHGVTLCDADGGVVDLDALLKKTPTSFDATMFIKGRSYRIVGCRLPEEVVNQRLRKANKTATEKGRCITDAYRLFLHYAIFLTNLPQAIPMEALYVIYRVRWQIELVFKTWKSILGIHRIQSAKYDRVMCELYGKLILAVLALRLNTLAEAKSKLPISLHRTMQTLKSMAATWAGAIVAGAQAHQRFINMFIHFVRCACKKRSSKNKPTIETRLDLFKAIKWTESTTLSPSSTGVFMA
jgi:hypothetical protein